MEKKTISEIQQIYDLELDKIIKTIKKEKAKKVLLQFPDGMKMYAPVILDELEKRGGGGVVFFIWGGSCFGGCDIPKVDDIDLVVQFGHSPWNYKDKQIKVLE